MPCFTPLKVEMVRKLDQLIRAHKIEGPFLEIGCGDGSLTAYLAARRWSGLALDVSDAAIAATRKSLRGLEGDGRVLLHRGTLRTAAAPSDFGLVVMVDVLEHVQEDQELVNEVRSKLRRGGFVFLSVPIKQQKWGWDDDGYGHVRRYSPHDLGEMFDSPASGFSTLCMWDITFPMITLMRDLMLRTMRLPDDQRTMKERNEDSAFKSSLGEGALRWAGERLLPWALIFRFQDLFRERMWGCNVVLLAQRKD